MVAEHDVEIELVFLAQLPRGTELLRAVGVMDRLRDPDGGCPWDLEQDHHSLARYLVEETYELLDAVASEDDADITEELGDVLLQVLFHARIAAERHAFGIDDVARGLVDKLVRRHPHVFAGVEGVEDADDVQRNWDRLKAEEKDGRGPLDGIPPACPASRCSTRCCAACAGSGWPRRSRRACSTSCVRRSTCSVRPRPRPATRTAGTGEDRALLVGRLLTEAASLARLLDVEADAAARAAAALLRAEVEAAVGEERDGTEVWDRAVRG
jgi:XTP/dITP diphosphohydrolase